MSDMPAQIAKSPARPARIQLAWTAFLLLAVLGVAPLLAPAQKDGRPTADAGIAPPLAKDGVPATVAISAGSFRMGADAAALPASVTNGFGVMSTRPEHGDFDELPPIPSASPMPSASASRKSRPPSIASSILPTSPALPLPHTPPESVGSRPPPTVRGSRRRPANPGACPPKRSGSTSPAPAARTSLATPTPCPRSIPPTHSARKTWASAAPNGPPTGTVHTSRASRSTPPAQPAVTPKSSVAAASTTGKPAEREKTAK